MTMMCIVQTNCSALIIDSPQQKSVPIKLCLIIGCILQTVLTSNKNNNQTHNSYI